MPETAAIASSHHINFDHKQFALHLAAVLRSQPKLAKLGNAEIIRRLKIVVQDLRADAAQRNRGQPQPEDFGIPRSKLAYLQKKRDQKIAYHERSHWTLALLLMGVLLAIPGWAYSPHVLWWLICPPVTMWAYGILIGLKTVVDAIERVPTFPALEAYESARTEWEQAEQEHREAQERATRRFWLNLPPDGITFEQELAKLYRSLGYRVEDTCRTGDDGIDLMLSKDGQRIAVQCKYLSTPVGVNAARDLIGAARIAGADRAVLAGVSGFTKGVRAYAANGHIQLVDLDDIVAMQQSRLTSHQLAALAPANASKGAR